MIRRHQHDRLPSASDLAPGVQQHAELLVRERNLAVVRAVVKTRPEGLRRIGRRVRVEQVHPHEDGPRGGRLPQPRQRRGHRLVSAAFDVGGPRRVVAAREPVVVDRKATTEAEPVVHRKPGHEGCRLVAGLREPLGDRGHVGAENEPGVVANPMAQRRQAGENRRVRGQRQRNVGHGVRKPDAPRRQRVDHWRRRAPIAVAAQMVRAERVDRHEQDVGVRAPLGRRRRGAPAPHPRGRAHDPDQGDGCQADGPEDRRETARRLGSWGRGDRGRGDRPGTTAMGHTA